jgi:cysteine-S-conjugate beta-lyase
LKYDLDKIYDRRNSDSIKWNSLKKMFGSEDVIPMWVADMDFPIAQPIVEAIQKRAEHPFYGYVKPDDSVIETVVDRVRKKYDWEIDPEWVVFTPGVIPALNAAVRSISHPGDNIILQPPVYFPFFPVVTSSGCNIADNPLNLKNDNYEIDFEDLESKFKSGAEVFPSVNRTKGVIFCNPHNPVGRVWSREEQIKVGEIVIGSGGIVIADEIHCEILFKGQKHVPFASISKEFENNSITCMAPSKTFSLAGLEISTIIITDKKLRENFIGIRSGIMPGPSIFGYVALDAAYRYGGEWLEQVLEYLQGNLDFLSKFLKIRIPRIKLIRPQGTYLMWLDCRNLGLNDRELERFFNEKARVGLNSGYIFGTGGSGFMRMNIACPRSLLEEALKRMEKAVNSRL